MIKGSNNPNCLSSPRRVRIAVFQLIVLVGFATSARPSAAQVPDVDSELSGIDTEIRELIHSAEEAGERPLDSMMQNAVRLQKLAERIGAYLRDHPGDSNRDRLLLARWEAMYLSATIRGESLEQIANELDVALLENSSSQLKDAVDYWRLRIAINFVRSEQALGKSDGREAIRLMQIYLTAHPSSAYAVSLADKVMEGLYEDGDIAGAEACIKLLEKHHPHHVVTKSLAGRQRLWRAVGRLWRPALTGLDGRPFGWGSSSDGPAMVIFWSPTHKPSVKMLQLARDYQQKAGNGALRVVTVGLHKSADDIQQELTKLGVAYPSAIEKADWRSDLAMEFGIRTLPTVLMLDREGRLKQFFVPQGWDMRADFEKAASSFLSAPTSQPATSRAAESQPASAPADGVMAQP